MNYLHIFPDASFDAEATQAMGRAFDIASRAMRKLGADQTERETIAKRIVDTAKKGERDPLRLKEQALSALCIDETLAKQMAA